MYLVFYVVFILLMVSFLLMLLSSMLSKKSLRDREKSSPFECGFDPYKTARLPFSLRFFMVAIVFLIFDVEITLLLPIPMVIVMSSGGVSYMLVILFLAFLLLGLYYEWLCGALDWS